MGELANTSIMLPAFLCSFPLVPILLVPLCLMSRCCEREKRNSPSQSLTLYLLFPLNELVIPEST